jgi:acyl carrier protein phosphodiesterase
MNFLAHLYLSGNEEHLIVGNFLADFIKNRQVVLLPRPIQESGCTARSTRSPTSTRS